ncbi:hypothetical protein [Amycolatopsis regifaucium]|uniref:Uncharacterized protein n=1 Tax=Amycolatopsis regifaucium TaxID=546365 RepID=A0A154MA94_9PSEU|nr:hypothetical protein [Amycolatopsis regifaucium]KZB81578.1 hypothetical protein AVL48_06130 [Amycolatopsis regifaucium]OKA06851.1 hypothetical protein ATP06_0220165 [Amycolatopsis regifaucium]
MVASAKETKLSRRAKDRLHHIHARAGIRQEGLGRALGPELRAIWGIPEDAEPERVREIVLLRLNRVLGRFADPLMPEIVWTAYNLGVDPADGESGMVGRLRGLVGRGQVAVSERTCTRRFYEFLASVKNSLDGFQEDLTGEDFRLASQWLTRNVRPDREELASPSALPEVPREPVSPVLRTFLERTVWGPADPAGAPLPARLGTHGDWFCVFTDERLLTEYRAATGAGWPRIHRRTGREVVAAAAGRAVATGVLVNPRPIRGSGIDAALPLSPDSVARLTVRR